MKFIPAVISVFLFLPTARATPADWTPLRSLTDRERRALTAELMSAFREIRLKVAIKDELREPLIEDLALSLVLLGTEHHRIPGRTKHRLDALSRDVVAWIYLYSTARENGAEDLFLQNLLAIFRSAFQHQAPAARTTLLNGLNSRVWWTSWRRTIVRGRNKFKSPDRARALAILAGFRTRLKALACAGHLAAPLARAN